MGMTLRSRLRRLGCSPGVSLLPRPTQRWTVRWRADRLQGSWSPARMVPSPKMPGPLRCMRTTPGSRPRPPPRPAPHSVSPHQPVCHRTAMRDVARRPAGQGAEPPSRLRTTSERGSWHEQTPGALPVEDLLPQDVRMPAVLGEFAQYVKVHPAQRERAAPVAVDPIVQPEG